VSGSRILTSPLTVPSTANQSQTETVKPTTDVITPTPIQTQTPTPNPNPNPTNSESEEQPKQQLKPPHNLLTTMKPIVQTTTIPSSTTTLFVRNNSSSSSLSSNGAAATKPLGQIKLTATPPSQTTTISIPASLSQSAKLILSNSINGPPKVIQQTISIQQQQTQAVKPEPVVINMSQPVDKVVEPAANETVVAATNSNSEPQSASQSEHKCVSSRPMIECEKCGAFCHSDCVFTNTTSENKVERLCSNCSKDTVVATATTPKLEANNI
jgi:hypothetical protein